MGSNGFFWFVIGLFLFQASWLVYSALYPMAFDEAYHFNLIRTYAGGWLPFLAEHPEGMGFNAVTRYPSYFFHYLMSFPYRLIELFTPVEFTQITLLRMINVGFFAGSLVLFRKLLIRSGLSSAMSNIGILLFSLIPIVPLLAAHINYDNLLILLIAWMLLLSQRIITFLQEKTIPLKEILIITIIGLFSAIVKYAVLPILLGIFGFLFLYGVWQFWKVPRQELTEKIKSGWGKMSLLLKISTLLLLLISGGLAFERYGVNLISYQSLVPACDQVLSEEQCMEFGPYERNVGYREARDPDFQPDRIAHGQRWFSGMWYRTFFMINGDVPVDRYQNFAPLPLPAIAATGVLLLGLFASAFYWRSVFARRPFIVMLAIVTLVYMAVLFFRNYSGYVDQGRTAALNGRYLLLIFPSVIAIIGLGLRRLFADLLKLKVVTSVIVIALFLQGGGLVSFLVRSSDSWYWPIDSVQQVNSRSQELIHPVIFGSDEEHLRTIPR